MDKPRYAPEALLGIWPRCAVTAPRGCAKPAIPTAYPGAIRLVGEGRAARRDASSGL